MQVYQTQYKCIDPQYKHTYSQNKRTRTQLLY